MGIEELKKALKAFIFFLHDCIIDMVDESEEWYNSFTEEIDKHYDAIDKS